MKIDLSQIGSQKARLIAAAVILIAVLGYGVTYGYGLYRDLEATKEQLAAKTSEFQNVKNELEQRLSQLLQENSEITATLSDEQRRSLELEREKRRNEREIDKLTKLTTIDPELLKKYSKVYFLSENYVPRDLDYINSEYVIDPNKRLQILEDVAPYLDDLLKEAEDDGMQLRVLSAYRSFQEQQQVKSGYRVQYGTGANAFSAEQGYSEHQLGTTADFTTPAIKGAYTSFESTKEFAWLQKNAHRFGFILSYPKGNGYYVYEPWHWRFVGEDLADDLHDDGKFFYQMEQRDIDEYLIKIFD